ncbi:MAG TPA: hypothetical protein VM008_08280 [Phycisphaerae bacterium]|nr:hypothetical protein [Phycisphaerae bacterium]
MPIIDFSNQPTATEMLAGAEENMRELLASIQTPRTLTIPTHITQPTAEKLENYNPKADSLKLKKHLLALQSQTMTMQHSAKAITKIVELCDSKKTEVARRAAMTILKLSHLDSPPDLYPLEDDFLFPDLEEDETPKPKKRKPPTTPTPAASGSAGQCATPPAPPPPPTPNITATTDITATTQFTLTTPAPPPYAKTLQSLYPLANLLILISILIFILHPTPPSQSDRSATAALSSFTVHHSSFPHPALPPIAIRETPVILTSMQNNTSTHHHTWRFFRAGGFDQVRIDTGADIANIQHLDKKLWVALACPTRGIEFDHKTLDLIDADHDGRIRAPELLAATHWACSLLKNPDALTRNSPALPLDAINDATPEGKQLHASAKQILINLGKPEATEITPEDTADTVKIFAQTQFNGDGILPPDAATDPAGGGLQSIINDIITCFGAETDRSGKPGINQDKLDIFFSDANAFATWQTEPETDPAKSPLGANTHAAATAIKAIAAKIEDFFARCRISAFDPRAAGVIARDLADYAALAPKDLSTGGGAQSEIAAFPLARITPSAAIPLTDTNAINPAWRSALTTLHAQVIDPLLGPRDFLTQDDWQLLLTRFAPFDSWLAAKAGHSVEILGLTHPHHPRQRRRCLLPRRHHRPHQQRQSPRPRSRRHTGCRQARPPPPRPPQAPQQLRLLPRLLHTAGGAPRQGRFPGRHPLPRPALLRPLHPRRRRRPPRPHGAPLPHLPRLLRLQAQNP